MRFQARACFTVVLLTLGGSIGWANMFESTRSAGNTARAPFPGQYGTVQIDLTNPTTAVITFTANPGFLFGGSRSVAVNINAANFAESSPSAIGPNKPPHFGSFGLGKVGDLGTFNSTLKLVGGFTKAADIIWFQVTDLSGTWASAEEVLTENNLAYDAAAHVYVCGDAACTAAGGAIATGLAGETGGTPSSAPEPASVVFLSTTLLGVALLWRRKVQSRRNC